MTEASEPAHNAGDPIPSKHQVSPWVTASSFRKCDQLSRMGNSQVEPVPSDRPSPRTKTTSASMLPHCPSHQQILTISPSHHVSKTFVPVIFTIHPSRLLHHPSALGLSRSSTSLPSIAPTGTITTSFISSFALPVYSNNLILQMPQNLDVPVWSVPKVHNTSFPTAPACVSSVAWVPG